MTRRIDRRETARGNPHPTKRGPGRRHGQGVRHGKPADPWAFAKLMMQFQKLRSGFNVQVEALKARQENESS